MELLDFARGSAFLSCFLAIAFLVVTIQQAMALK